MIYLLGFALFYLTITSVVLIRNRFEFKSLSTEKSSISSSKKVSICVPARNEEASIEKCVTSLVKQNYSNYNVLVLDDNSEDQTLAILLQLQKEYSHLNIINGTTKPNEWLGKPWACHQLSRNADGEILIFVDADVWLEPNAVEKAVSSLEKNDALTVWPKQVVVGFLEQLIVPTIYFSLLTLLPSVYVRRSPKWMPNFLRPFMNPKFVAACGQFIAFNRKTYDSINGHEGVKNAVVEDMELARNLKNNGNSIRMFNGLSIVNCRMYDSSKDIWNGFQKNFLKGFASYFDFLFMALIHIVVFLFPWFSLYVGLVENDFLITLLSIICITIYTIQRLILNKWFSWNWWMAFFHTLAVVWFQILGLKCVLNEVFGWKSTWKGRSV